MNLRNLYFSNSQFNWVLLKFSLILVFFIKSFRYILTVSLFNNELLNFQKPGPIGMFFISLYEIQTCEWSLKIAGNTFVFKIDSCKALEMKM